MTCDTPSAFVVAACVTACSFRFISGAISSRPIAFGRMALLGGFAGFLAPDVVGASAVCSSAGAAESADDSNNDSSGFAGYMLALMNSLLLFMMIAFCFTYFLSPFAY